MKSHLVTDNIIVVHVCIADRAERVGALENVGAFLLVEGKRRLEKLACERESSEQILYKSISSRQRNEEGVRLFVN